MDVENNVWGLSEESASMPLTGITLDNDNLKKYFNIWLKDGSSEKVNELIDKITPLLNEINKEIYNDEFIINFQVNSNNWKFNDWFEEYKKTLKD